MNAKIFFNRKILLTALLGWVLGASAFAGDDPRIELRHRLDSLNFEKQERRRQGKHIDDLEAATTALQDTLAGLRGYVHPETPDDGERPAGWIASYLGDVNIPFLEEILSFQPRGTFDWIVVGTGGVALLSGAVLIIGIIAGRGKKTSGRSKKGVGRKINLAPTRTQAAVSEFTAADPDNAADILPRQPFPAAGAGYNFGGKDGRFPAGGATYNFSGRIGSPAGDVKAEGVGGGDPRDPVSDLQSLMEKLRSIAPPPPASPAVPPPAPPPAPLVVNAPEPPELPAVPLARAPGAQPPGNGQPLPSFNELVMAASKSGLSEQEISRRYQLSVDLVRLILRMSKNDVT